jgi:hypothetical protein
MLHAAARRSTLDLHERDACVRAGCVTGAPSHSGKAEPYLQNSTTLEPHRILLAEPASSLPPGGGSNIVTVGPEQRRLRQHRHRPRGNIHDRPTSGIRRCLHRPAVRIQPLRVPRPSPGARRSPDTPAGREPGHRCGEATTRAIGVCGRFGRCARVVSRPNPSGSMTPTPRWNDSLKSVCPIVLMVGPEVPTRVVKSVSPQPRRAGHAFGHSDVAGGSGEQRGIVCSARAALTAAVTDDFETGVRRWMLGPTRSG